MKAIFIIFPHIVLVDVNNAIKQGEISFRMFQMISYISSILVWDQMAERLGSRTINHKVVGSIPGCAK